MSVNIVILSGNLVADPDMSYTNSGTAVTRFRVAVNRFFKKANGEKGEEADFFNCEAWDTGAETINQILHKGDAVLVEGALKNESWEKDGQTVRATKVRVQRFQKLSRKNPNSTEESNSQTPVVVNEGDEIPF